MVKPDFLYNQGMKIMTYSLKSEAMNHKGWSRDGKHIAYYKNSIQRKTGNITIPTGSNSLCGTNYYYTLTFTITPECNFNT